MRALSRASGATASIHRRLSAMLLGMALFGAAVTGLTVWHVLDHELDELMDQGLRESAELIHNVMAGRMARAGDDVPEAHYEYEEHLVWQMVDRSTATVLARSHKAPEAPLLGQPASGIVDDPSREWRVVSMDFGARPDRFLLVAQAYEERGASQWEAVTGAVAASGLAALVGVLVLSWFLRREMRLLKTFSEAVRRYEPTDPRTIPASAQRTEIEPVVHAVRELGERLAQRIATEQAFAAHAAHALRTPLAGMEAQLAVAEREADVGLRLRLQKMRSAAQRLHHVMQALLAMFRSGRDPVLVECELSDLLDTLAQGELEVHCTPGSRLMADEDLLSAVLLNLLDNARQHDARNVQILLEPSSSGPCLVLVDDGSGCDPERLARMRAALARHDYSSSSGLRGLGLVLADLVMRAHGGHVELRAVEQGFCVALQFPARSKLAD